MESEKNETEAYGAEPVVMEGTREMGYWTFKKAICAEKGWQLRRIDAQTYEVIDRKHEKIGVFKSGEGYLPNPAAVADTETQPESA
jgi:hypothetical protein